MEMYEQVRRVLRMGKEYLEELINEKKMTAEGGRVEDTY